MALAVSGLMDSSNSMPTLNTPKLDAARSYNKDQVFKKVTDSWIPAQTGMIDEILAKIYAGFYNNSMAVLVDDLKKDLGSYLYVCPTIVDMALKEYERGANGQLELKTILPRVTLLLHQAKKNLRESNLEDTSDFQREIFNEAVLSAEVVAKLSPEIGLAPDSCHALASLRYIGRVLLAWNYPEEFKEALVILNTKSVEASLDTILTNIFGFSPATLGGRVTLEMGLIKDISDPVETTRHDTGSHSNPQRTLDKLRRLCRLGEAFAMAHSSIRHPIQEDKIVEAIKLLKKHHKESALATIYQRVSVFSIAQTTNYELFVNSSELEGEDEPTRRISEKIELVRLSRLAGIPTEKSRPVIDSLIGNQASDKVIKELFHFLLPEAGIVSNIVFIESPLEGSLIPIFKKGTSSFVKAAVVTLGAYSDQKHLARDIFYQKTPWIAEGISIDGDESIFALMPIPEKKPYGVLYLEARRQDIGKDALENLGKFTSKCFALLYKRQ